MNEHRWGAMLVAREHATGISGLGRAGTPGRRAGRLDDRAGMSGRRTGTPGRRSIMLAAVAVLPATLLLAGFTGPAASASAVPGPGGAAHVTRHAAGGGGRLSAAWPKVYHPRHASPGVLALRGEPLRSPAVRATAPRGSDRPRPAQCPVPSAPGSVSATAGANQATVTWSAANGNGSTITAYLIREATGADAGASITTSGSATTATLTGLAGAAAATFSVVAQSSCGAGPAGTSAAVTPGGATSTYLGSVQASGPAAFYRLAEPGGATVIADSSGNDADGTYSGQESLGQAAALASDPATSTGYATCCSGIGSASPALPMFSAARTVEAWVNTSSGTTNQAIASYGATTTDEAFIVSVSAGSINVDGWNDYLEFPIPRPVDDGHWHLLDVSYDGTTVTVYLDGQQVGSAPFAGTVNTFDPAGLTMGVFSNYNVLNGDEADVAVYPAALTPATVTAHFGASGYSRPSAVKNASVFFGGPNAADVSWGSPTGGGGATSYLVSALGGQGSPSVTVPGDAT
ncbi:MAG TPA: LamG-like jellyroll fold domain-containing protein, partial [Streptosporangiaceae bacterium]